MGEVEPEGAEPNDVDDVEDTKAEGVGNPIEASGRGKLACRLSEFGPHHVGPEVEEVYEKATNDDYTENKHVFGCPVYGLLAGNSITIIATCFPVLEGQDEGIDEMDDNEQSQTGSTKERVPVGAQEFTDLVVVMSVGRCAYHNIIHVNKVHQHVEGEEEHEACTSDAHYHLTTD